jgi:putative salt-induced outer membrane protein YdiY
MSHKWSLGALLLFVWLFGAAGLNAQIVNIEQRRIKTDTTGLFGGLHFSFVGSKTTKSIVAFSGGTYLELKPARKKDRSYYRDLWLFLTDFSLVSGNNEKFSNSGFGHLRFTRKLGKDYARLGQFIRWESFVQIQYNDLTKIGTRTLVGTGPRFKLTDSEVSKFYLGVAYMYEYQEFINPEVYLRQHRMSSYFSFTLLPEEAVTFISTTYFQPVLNNFSDYRFSNETSLSLDITKKFSFWFSFNYNFNSAPPEEVPNNTYYFKNRLLYEF